MPWQVPGVAIPSRVQSHISLALTCCHHTLHPRKTHPTTLGTIKSRLLSNRPRLSLRGSSLLQAGEQHVHPHASCLAQLSSALGDATAGKQTRRDGVLACR